MISEKDKNKCEEGATGGNGAKWDCGEVGEWIKQAQKGAGWEGRRGKGQKVVGKKSNLGWG